MNPYKSRPDYAFWSRAVARVKPECVDPVISSCFKIGINDKVATAGSCFAQHIAKTLAKRGFNYFVSESGPVERQYGVFPARFGNLYTVKQLLQLFQRAYGLFDPVDRYWVRNGTFVDPFRPQIEDAGFASIDALEEDRAIHLAAVRRMFEQCDVFVFTLGLTEGWRSSRDGAVFPLAPGVSGEPEQDFGYEFCNFPVHEMADDLVAFVDKLRIVNPGVRVVLTVSPVPLVATFENRHVMVSTIYSKSALRVVAEMVSQSRENVAYFPSYEIITGHHTRYCYFEQDLRSVSPEGVERVMTLFCEHYLSTEQREWSAPEQAESSVSDEERDALYEVICEEEELDQ